MFDITSLWLFIVAVFLLSVTPGPDLAYAVGQSVANGRRAGVISAAGVALGSCTHALASVVGLTALIAASPTLFNVVKLAGALYLIYLGIRFLGTFGKEQADDPEQPRIRPEVSLRSLLRSEERRV